MEKEENRMIKHMRISNSISALLIGIIVMLKIIIYLLQKA